jgi:hypothetical protein
VSIVSNVERSSRALACRIDMSKFAVESRPPTGGARDRELRRRAALSVPLPVAGRKTEVIADVFPKSLTGIKGLDEITGGGLPAGRPTLVCRSAGCGKTLLAMEFLVRGATRCGEPGVFMAFEETAEELTQNVASLGFELGNLIARKQLYIDHVHIDRNEIAETGEFDLDGLFVRLAHGIDSTGAKRVVLDTLESLFSSLSNEMILRAELRRLFRWFEAKARNVSGRSLNRE